MTGLELCRRIADAVIAEYVCGAGPRDLERMPDHAHGPTLAVLRTLEAAGAGLAIADGGDPETLRGQVNLFQDFDRR